MEEIEITFTPEIVEDITKDLVGKTTIDFIINYEDGILNTEQLTEIKNNFIQDDFYYYAEAVNRAIKAIKIIFE
ncbi:hypothetical protein [Polaribacter sp.]|uniref:hypothetical protein n=1 Tax=Polaribacter sp. TaxID=1920175 RepID=UPI003F6BC6BA